MKISTIVSVMTLIAGVSGTLSFANEKPRRNSDDSPLAHKLFKEVSVTAQPSDMNGIPTSVKCGDGDNAVSVELQLPKNAQESNGVATDIKHRRLLVDLSDGDQIGGYVFKRVDLIDLKKGKVQKINAIELGGFWWADGDHYSAGPTTCQLN